MAWLSTGSTNAALIRNLYNNGLIKSERVKNAMQAVDRAHYAPMMAYQDSPQAIGFGATISAPHMHAAAAESLLPRLHPSARVLDVGSGSGYLTVVLAHLVGPRGRVVGVDHIQGLVDLAAGNVAKSEEGRQMLASGRVSFVKADGRLGYRDEDDDGGGAGAGGDGGAGGGGDTNAAVAGWDAIHVGAAATEAHGPLVEQLRAPGRLFIPVVGGEDMQMQYIWVIDKKEDGTVVRERSIGVRYVPLTDAPA